MSGAIRIRPLERRTFESVRDEGLMVKTLPRPYAALGRYALLCGIQDLEGRLVPHTGPSGAT